VERTKIIRVLCEGGVRTHQENWVHFSPVCRRVHPSRRSRRGGRREEVGSSPIIPLLPPLTMKGLRNSAPFLIFLERRKKDLNSPEWARSDRKGRD